jgi:hypothetical protein
MRKLFAGGLIAMGAVFAAAPLDAQLVDEVRQPRVHLGVQPLYARTVGEFSDYVEHGGGLNFNVVFPITTGSPLALRADAGFIVYGSETREVCFSTTVGCRIQLDLTTTNGIGYLNAGPQLMLPTGPVRPYVNGAIGFAYFGTSSSVQGTESNEDIASTTNFDDFAFAWNAGGGLLFLLGGRTNPISLDVSARYHGNGRVEYLKEGDIIDHPDGSITLLPTLSDGNLVTFQIGVSVGVGPQRQ